MAALENHRLHRLFHPRSVAVVGASERSPWTLQIMGAFEQYRFDGDIHLINRRAAVSRGQLLRPCERRDHRRLRIRLPARLRPQRLNRPGKHGQGRVFLARQDAKGVTGTVHKDLDYIVYHNL